MATIVLRLVKGSRLTKEQADDNWNNINVEVEAATAAIIVNAADIATNVTDIATNVTDILAKVDKAAINDQSGTTYTLALTDANDYVRMSNAAQQTVTVPPNSSVAFTIGDKIDIGRAGAGFVTVAEGAGVTINSTNLTITKKGRVTLVKVASDTWDLVGNTSPLFNTDIIEYSTLFDTTSEGGDPAGVVFKPDGLKMYILHYQNDTIYQYTLSTAWDISSASYASLSVLLSWSSRPEGMFLGDTGTKLYTADTYSGFIVQATLSTAWDISTATSDSKNKSVNAEGGCYGVSFNADGTKMYTTNYKGCFQYTLSTAWDVSTASYASKSLNSTIEVKGGQGLWLNSDGTRLWVAGVEYVAKYSLSTAYDISTATADEYAFPWVGYTGVQDVAMSESEDKLYIINSSTIFDDSMLEYDVPV